jgi:alpha-ketoglutaric semialdehyde dehydrogenase
MAFTETFVAKPKALKVGDARDPESFLGPAVDARQYDKVRGYIRAALAEGARLLTGGDDGANPVGYFVAPTIFDGVRPDMTIAREEIFGPVVALLEAVDFEAAMRLANDTEYGLSASICTRDLGRAHAFVSRVESGVASVSLPTAGVELHAPLGGTRASGIRIKEQGRPVLEFYTEWRSVHMKIA